MTLKQKIKEIGRQAKLVVVGSAALALPLIVASVALNGCERAVRYGSEQVAEPWVETREYKARLEDRGESLLLGTHGRLCYGDFDVEDGSQVRLSDGAYLSGGKFWENTRIPGLEEGRKYNVKVVGNDTIGWTLLDANEIR